MDVLSGELSKICRGCGEGKPISEYSYQVKAQGTRHSRCKACMNFEHALYVQVKKFGNPTFSTDYRRAWRNKDQNGRRKNFGTLTSSRWSNMKRCWLSKVANARFAARPRMMGRNDTWGLTMIMLRGKSEGFFIYVAMRQLGC